MKISQNATIEKLTKYAGRIAKIQYDDDLDRWTPFGVLTDFELVEGNLLFGKQFTVSVGELKQFTLHPEKTQIEFLD